MKKRLLSMLFVLVMVLGMIPSTLFPAFAADTVEEALGEISIYNSGVDLNYLCVNGRAKTQPYDYYLYTNSKKKRGKAGEAIKALDSTVTIAKADGKSAAGTKLMALMGLGIKQGETVIVTIEGGDEDASAAVMEQFFKDNL